MRPYSPSVNLLDPYPRVQRFGAHSGVWLVGAMH
jgi:hypothetical protein